MSPRKLVQDDLSVGLINASEAIVRARRTVGVAFDLILEDEVAHFHDGRKTEIFLGRWLTDAHGNPRQNVHSLRRRVQGVLEATLVLAFERGQVNEIQHVTALAAATELRLEGGSVDRTSLLRDWSPRAQLLPPLMAALLSQEGLLPPLVAWGFSTHAGRAGEDAVAYGVHREPHHRASERLGSLDVIGGDSRAAVAMTEFVHGTSEQFDGLPEDSARRAQIRREFELEGGGVPPSTPADHLDPLLALASEVTGLVRRAQKRNSRALQEADVVPARLLTTGVPSWAVAEPLAYGPFLDAADLRSPRYWPGCDPAVFRSAHSHRIPLLGLAFTSAALDGGTVSGINRLLLLDPILAGSDVAELLCSDERQIELESLRQASADELEALAEHPLAQTAGVNFDGVNETALTLPHGNLVISGRRATPVKVSMLLVSALASSDAVDVEAGGTFGWATNVDLEDEPKRDSALLIAQLHRQAMMPLPPLGNCMRRPYDVFPVHQIKSGQRKTRRNVRIISMLANLVMVAEGRAAQANQSSQG